jgi:Putative beta-barrel porin-2, OmpL-like. bbp2/Carboxypeptidase regulatory-like domain
MQSSMRRWVLNYVLAAALAVALPIMAMSSEAPATAAVSIGTVVGLLTDQAGQPMSHATVTLTRADGSSMRAVLSGADGVYAFADVPAGQWLIVASKEGLPAMAAQSLYVTASQATRYDFRVPAGAAEHVVSPPLVAASRSTYGVPEALQQPDPPPANDADTPFADSDTTWANGTTRNSAPIFDTKFFTPEIRFDANYLQDFNHPKDHTIVGSTEEFRSGEFQIEQVSFGGDFHWHNVKARFLSMFGDFATTTPRNDASAGVGQYDLQGAYKYMSEANAGYHFDVSHGLNVDAGIFVSYIGLFSYYNFDNWVYQPSFVSSNTPWFFNGLRIQWFPTQHLKIEPWIINGWQSYAKFNHHPGLGGQVLYIPNDRVRLVFNSYFFGQDNLSAGAQNPSGGPGNFYGVGVNPCGGGDPHAAVGTCSAAYRAVNWAHVQRIHEDDSVEVKYYDSHGQSGAGPSKMAFSLTWDIGCEYGGGVSCSRGPNKTNFVGVMAYNRTWFDHDLYAISVGGGFMNNPGRYLALVPPINGATAQSGSVYFSEAPGEKLFQWDAQLNLQYMPAPWITWWTETTFRHSDVPYWSGGGGVTPPGGNTGAPGSMVCNNGTVAGGDACSSEGGTWNPDLRTREVVWGAGVLVKF